MYVTTSVDTVGVHFTVQPRRKVNRLQVVLGLSRAGADDSGPFERTGRSRLARTWPVRGRSLQVGWRDDGADKSRFGFTYGEPLAFGTPLDMELSLDHEVQREVYTRFRLDNSWLLPVVDLWGVEVGFGWDRSTFPVGDLASTRRWRARVAVQHRRGDRTRDGWHGVFAVETARRTGELRTADEDSQTTTAVTSSLGEAVSQRIFEVDVDGEVWLARSWSLFGRAAFRELSGDEQDVPLVRAVPLRWCDVATRSSGGCFPRYARGLGGPSNCASDGRIAPVFTPSTTWAIFNFRPSIRRPKTLNDARGPPAGPGDSGSVCWLGPAPATFRLAIGFPGSVDFETAMLHVSLLETF